MTIDRDNARALIAEAREAAIGHRHLGGAAHNGDASRYDRLADALEAALTPPQIDRDALAERLFLAVGRDDWAGAYDDDREDFYAQVDAVMAHLSAVPVEPQQDAPAGPAYVGAMPPSPESSRQTWTMYCRVCGVEEFMADSPDDAALLAHRDKHNAEVHPAVPVEGDREALAERLRQIAESQRMDFDSPHVALTLEEAADALSRSPLPVEGEVDDMTIADAEQEERDNTYGPWEVAP